VRSRMNPRRREPSHDRRCRGPASKHCDSTCHGPDVMKERLIAPYFVNEVQREIFEALSTKHSLSELIDALQLRGQEAAAQVLSEIAVEELERHYSQSDVTAVGGATHEECGQDGTAKPRP